MIQHIAIVGSGLLLYLLLCGIACLAGYGLLRLLGLATASPAMVLLAPIATLVFWSLVIGMTVGLRAPMQAVTPWLWGMTAVLALNGLRRPWLAWRFESALLLLCAALPVVVMARYFWHGLSDYSGSVAPDGWAYISYGQYLWEYSRGTEGGLAPLYQFAAYLSTVRYISPAMLGFLSPLVSAGDTQTVSSLLQAWTLFCTACAVAFFWASEMTKRWMIVTATVVSIVAGWSANLIWANNFDNGLALVYAPAVAGIAAMLELRSWRWWILLGGMLAALLYTYPELALVIIASAVLIALPRVWHERAHWQAWLGGSALALVVAFVLVLPVLQLLTTFMLAQVSSIAASSDRPGEGLFKGLIVPHFIPAAIWGLGGEHQILALSRVRNLLGLALSASAGLGAIILLRRRQWGLVAAVALLLVGAAYFIFRKQYSYATYKLIIINWWGMVALLVTGIDWAIARVRQASLRRGVIAGCAVLLMLALSQSNHINADTTSTYVSSSNQQLSAAEFRQVREIKAIVGNNAVTVLVDDWLASEWAVYYLRDTPIDLAEYGMYMAQPGVLPTMHRAQAVAPEQARYVLTDAKPDSAIAKAQHWRQVWSGGPYQLWQPADVEWATITNITNPNGIEQVDGKQFLWLGQGDTAIDVFAQQAGLLSITATFRLGPSVADQKKRQLLITTDAGYQHQVAISSASTALSVPVQAGSNQIVLRPLDKPDVVDAAQKDPRPLILGVQGMQVRLEDSLAVINQIKNANGLEQVDGEPFFWLGQGTTSISITCVRAGRLLLGGQILPGPSAPNIDIHKLLLTTDRGYRSNLDLNSGAQTIELPVEAGVNQIHLTALDTATISTPNGDKRTLLLGIKGAWVQLVVE